MIMVAMVVVITTIHNPDESPKVSVPAIYKNMKECQNQLDELKKSIDAKDIYDNKKNRFLKYENREFNQKGSIFWYCKLEDNTQ